MGNLIKDQRYNDGDNGNNNYIIPNFDHFVK